PDYHGNSLALNNLGNIYKERGDFAQAEPLYRRALTIAEQTLPPEHPNVGLFLSNLGNLYRERGEYGRAEPLFQRALAVKEKTLGPTHFSVAYTLNDLAFVYSEKGRYAEAEPLFQRALTILEKAAGPEHFSVATVLNNLGTLYRRKGDYAQAEPLYRRALALREKAFGPLHPLMATSYGELARLSAGQGDRARAVASMADANQVSEHNLALNLATGSERQKLAYLSLLSKQTDLTLSIHSLTAPDDPQALHLAFTTLLRRKGRGLDVMTDTVAALRRRAQPEDRALLDQLAQARSQLAALSLKEPGGARPETYRARLKPLEERVEKLESELSAHSAEFRAQAQPVTIETVQAAIPAETILVEFAVYTPQQPATESSQPPHYLAYLLAAQGPPRWVALGETAPIDRAVEDWRQALRDPDRKDVKSLARAVDEQVMRPVRAAIQSGMGIPRRLLIAPDGSLNLIPFAALVDRRKRYLVERYAISYLTSGRDLLRQPAPEPTRNAPLVVANPAFGKVATLAARADQSPENLRTGNPATARVDQTQVFFQPLPGTEEEARAIKSVLPETSLLLREEATEAALKRARAPRILHIATHGFFFNEQRSPEDLPPTAGLRLSKWTAQVENPLLRSGLALAGANQGLSGDDDGVLTALEAAGLDLWGTELVVLSACDTGLGEIKNGEGVQGLRRALVLAGSQSQVMSLWPVPDETTKDLMVPYYRALRQGAGRGDGLRRVQLRMLRSRSQRHPFYWAAFIQSGDWSRLK
ncbi:MAG TPA: CHAT domain-containing tetratricopeptide repeat protein, partial [Blastocatellia bacterium]|nr:CHAT domain-containing tetratricopeptide repeat protein [Blastocatellia bacterium]